MPHDALCCSEVITLKNKEYSYKKQARRLAFLLTDSSIHQLNITGVVITVEYFMDPIMEMILGNCSLCGRFEFDKNGYPQCVLK